MDKKPDYKIIEKEIQDLWFEKNKDKFYFDINKDKKFIIDSPPPFTSGEAHMGHALEWSWMDFIARYKRLDGYNVYFPLGFDCHGLPTELKIIKKGIKRDNIKEFLDECEKFTLNSIESMKKTFLRIGASHDLQKEYKTIDKLYIAFVQYTLIKMFNDGLIERKKVPILWCPKCNTSISMQEAGYIERDGEMFYIKLPIKDSNNYLLIATTRPELINSCVAVLIKNKDYVINNNLIFSEEYAKKNNIEIKEKVNYKDLENKKVIIPLINREVPIIVDEDVEYEFGTGIVWVCTYGDPSDVKWKEKYNLPEIISIDEYGRINYENSPLNKLKLDEARDKLKELLKDYIIKIEKIKHNVLSHTERSSCLSPLELLPREQFYINVLKFKDKLLEWQKEIRFIPEEHRNKLIDWINSLDIDWNISRTKMAWGVSFPFIRVNDKIIPVDLEDLPVDFRFENDKKEKYIRKYGNIETFDNEVLDVWIESSITPLAIILYSLIDKNNFNPKDFDKYFEEIIKYLPVDLRQQGYEIIRTWLFYTFFRVKILTNKIPWKNALIHGMVLDEKGIKMSKSLGNAVDPNQIMDKYSPDALRYWALMSAYDDYRFTYKDIETGQNYIIKIWNIGRFIEMNNINNIDLSNLQELKEEDKDIIKKLIDTINESKKYIEEYKFQEYNKIWRKFVWDDFANGYLEKVKDRIRNNDISSKWTIKLIYKAILLYLHPIFPYITEYLNIHLFNSNKLLIEEKFEYIDMILKNVKL